MLVCVCVCVFVCVCVWGGVRARGGAQLVGWDGLCATSTGGTHTLAGSMIMPPSEQDCQQDQPRHAQRLCAGTQSHFGPFCQIQPHPNHHPTITTARPRDPCRHFVQNAASEGYAEVRADPRQGSEGTPVIRAAGEREGGGELT